MQIDPWYSSNRAGKVFYRRSPPLSVCSPDDHDSMATPIASPIPEHSSGRNLVELIVGNEPRVHELLVLFSIPDRGIHPDAVPTVRDVVVGGDDLLGERWVRCPSRSVPVSSLHTQREVTKIYWQVDMSHVSTNR